MYGPDDIEGGERRHNQGDRRHSVAAASGSMSVSDAGRKGGETTLRERGPGFYSEIGREGGKHSHDKDKKRSRLDDEW